LVLYINILQQFSHCWPRYNLDYL